MLRIFLWIVRIYYWLLLIWAIGTWIPGFAGSAIHNIIGIPIYPVIGIFSFASIGPVGFGALIVAFGLYYLENYLTKLLNEQEGTVPDPKMRVPEDEGYIDVEANEPRNNQDDYR